MNHWAKKFLLFTAFVLVFGYVHTARGGIYSTAESFYEDVTSSDQRAFEDALIQVKRLNIPTFHTPMRQRALLAISLAEQNPGSRLSAEESLNLSAYLLWMNKSEEAIGGLRPAVRQERHAYLLNANLGTACQFAGQIDLARDYLSMVKTWPKDWDSMKPDQRKYFENLGWNRDKYEWYHKVEEYHYRLLNLRRKEKPVNTSLPETVDALFVGNDGKPIQFVGENGKYEAGKIAKAEYHKLPHDAENIVEQLLIWFPNDLRLYWLLAELRNAKGNVPSARRMLKEIIQNGGRSETLIQHSRLLAEAPDQSSAKDKDENQLIANKETSAFNLNPWQLFAVGVGGGFLLFLFGNWQLREVMRRTRKRSSAANS